MATLTEKELPWEYQRYKVNHCTLSCFHDALWQEVKIQYMFVFIWLLMLSNPTACPARPPDLREGSQLHDSTANSWWSEVIILGHGLIGSHKNGPHSNHLLLCSVWAGPIWAAAQTHWVGFVRPILHHHILSSLDCCSLNTTGGLIEVLRSCCS